jgi:uncharacterized membrane protein
MTDPHYSPLMFLFNAVWVYEATLVLVALIFLTALLFWDDDE